MRVVMGENYTFTNVLAPISIGQLVGKGKGIVNDIGQTTEGDLYTNVLYSTDRGLSAGMTVGSTSKNCRISAPQGACIIRVTKEDFLDTYMYKEREILVQNPYKATEIDFFMLATRMTDTAVKINKKSDVEYRSEYKWISNNPYAEVDQRVLNSPVPMNENFCTYSSATSLSNMDEWITSLNNIYKTRTDGERTFMTDTQLTEVMQKLSALSLDDRSIAGTIRLQYIAMSSIFTAASSDNVKNVFRTVQSVAESQFPIFHYNQIQDIIDYFRDGGGKPENEDYRELKDVDLSTNWTIYIDGNYPNITITADTPDLEGWLDSAGNTEALTKENFSLNAYYRMAQVLSQDTQIHGILYGVRHLIDKSKYGESIQMQYTYIDNREFPSLSNTGSGVAPYGICITIQLLLGLYRSAPLDVYMFYIGNPKDPNFDTSKFYWKFASESKIPGDSKLDPVIPFFTDSSTVTFIFEPYEGDEDPEPPVPPEDDIVIDEPSDLTDQSVLLKHYQLNEGQIKQLGNFLWGETFNLKDLFNINSAPLQNITNVMHCPFSDPFITTSTTLTIGNVDTLINAKRITTVSKMKVGQIHIKPLYNSFLDFAPYTTVTLFLPFYGFLDLDATLFGGVEANRLLEVYLIVDITTGTFEYMIYRGGVFIKKVTTAGMVEIAMTANDSAIVNSRAAVGVVSDLIPSIPGGMFSSSEKQVALTSKAFGVNYGIKATKTLLEYAQPFYTSETKGTNAPNCSWSETRQIYVIVERPYAMTYPTTYGHTIGYPLKTSRKLGTLSGFTVCNVDTDLSGISALEEEKDEIRALLANGIFL